MAKQKLNKKTVLITLLIVALLFTVLLVLEKKSIINIYSKDGPAITEAEETTSTAETAQSDFTGTDDRMPGNTLDENKGSGGIVDDSGSVGGNIDMSNPIVSSTKEITLYSPKSNASVANGIEVSGNSTLPKISYRIIDNISGVISMGELVVNGGRFAGKLSVETSASDGRIDFYATKQDGVEFSNIEVPVRFK